MKNTISLFSLFWENTKINKFNLLRLAKRLDEDARISGKLSQLFYPTEDLVLVKPNDTLATLMAKRKSSRAFSSSPLSEKQLGSLFYGFSCVDGTRRAVPSAGAKYPIEVYAFLFNVRSKLNNTIVYYNPDTHSLSRVAACPSWDSVKESFGLQLDGIPALFVVFVGIAERTTDKYGERGGRFVLLEAGHYAQNFALRVAHEGLRGVISGALHDDDIKKLLRLTTTNALITVGFACGK